MLKVRIDYSRLCQQCFSEDATSGFLLVSSDKATFYYLKYNLIRRRSKDSDDRGYNR